MSAAYFNYFVCSGRDKYDYRCEWEATGKEMLAYLTWSLSNERWSKPAKPGEVEFCLTRLRAAVAHGESIKLKVRGDFIEVQAVKQPAAGLGRFHG